MGEEAMKLVRGCDRAVVAHGGNMPTTGGSAEREGEICRGQDGVFGETPQGAYLTRRPPRRPEALFLDGDGVKNFVECVSGDVFNQA